jgi:hypothetical protein
VLARHPNVYTDTSGVRRFDLLAEALSRAGPGKMLFGTDGPWLHPGVELSKVAALGLAAHHRHLVVAGNWLRLTAAARARARSRLLAVNPAPARATAGRRGHHPLPDPDRGDPWLARQAAAVG